MKELKVLGIETSCDETAAAVLRGFAEARPGAWRGPPEILSNVVLSQTEMHAPYGGVVPEIAARAHVSALDDVIRAALDEAKVRFQDLDAVAATAGPGLIGGLLTGLMTGKAIAATHRLPFLAINHLEGHALSIRITEFIAFPYLLLLVSGGHCQLLAVEAPGRYRRYGTTIDDAAGEAFDKAAKTLGLGYPGGPAIEALARGGNPKAFPLPRPLIGEESLDFSFAGLKTAVIRTFRGLGPGATLQLQADLAASFQAAVADVLADRSARAMARFRHETGVMAPAFVVAGGVAANAELRRRLLAVAAEAGFSFHAPPLALCADNAAMIAWAGLERFHLGLIDDLTVGARVRWPLDPEPSSRDAAKAGRKGPKA